MKCCAYCFGDRGLQNQIIPTFSEHSGTCDFCGTENVQLVEPTKLKDYFELVIHIYKRDDAGKCLVELFKEDWGMFTHSTMDMVHANSLLCEILDDREIVNYKYVPSDLCQSDRLAVWEKLRNELMYENRFFPQTSFDEDRLEGLLSHLLIKSNELSNEWFRARIQSSEEIYPADKMSAPPKRIASQGRANPAGIPYLYLASSQKTAVSEIRPHTGAFASVASFKISNVLNFVDLRNPLYTVSPFILGDETEVALLRGDIEFLVQLGHELTRPVLPQEVAINYIPSQYLCEFIKKSGYNGVVYKSSVGDGINLALFDPNSATIGSVGRCRVSHVHVEISC